MNVYVPDNWIVFRTDIPTPHYRVLAGWSGGYAEGSSWRMNSGVAKVEKESDYYLFHGSSGSVYQCHKNSYGLRMSNVHIWMQLEDKYKDKVSMLDSGTDWLNYDWSK